MAPPNPCPSYSPWEAVVVDERGASAAPREPCQRERIQFRYSQATLSVGTEGPSCCSYSGLGLCCIPEQKEESHATSCYAAAGLSCPDPSGTDQMNMKKGKPVLAWKPGEAYPWARNAVDLWEMGKIQTGGRPPQRPPPRSWITILLSAKVKTSLMRSKQMRS